MHDLHIGPSVASPVVYGHGWARDHRDFIPAAESLARVARSFLVDFPGFGQTARPDECWGSAEYADHMARYIVDTIGAPVVWVGHSFGGRVGIQLAARHPDLVKGMVLVGAAGVRPSRSTLQRWRGRLRQRQFRALRNRARSDAEREALEARFGSADYVASGALGIRDIFVKVVNEDQSDFLRRVRAPTAFLYGARDSETPPELGQRMSALVGGSTFEILPEFDHNTILSRGYHILARRIREVSGGER